MRYESEVLYDLMKRDGLLNPSQDNLPYESELKEKYVNDVKGAYPKLIDYCAEWLNYAYENPIGEFPYETLTNVTEATVNNVVPYAYKSAILTGNTIKRYKNNLFDGLIENGGLSINTGENDDRYPTRGRSINFIKVEPNSTITFARNLGANGFHVVGYNKNKEFVKGFTDVMKANVLNGKINTTNDIYYIRFYDITPTSESEFGVFQGDVEPTYELTSVKMPVLTTTGKNLLNMNDYSLRYATTFVGSTDNSITFTTTEAWGGLVYDFFLKPNQTYHISFDSPQTSSELKGFIRLLNTSSSTIGGQKSYSFTTDSTGRVRFTLETTTALENVTVSNIQIEEGSVATPYEPYKTNILTVNEDVELRGVGEVRDTVDLMTGELTQRIGEVVLDGSETWSANGNDGRYFCQKYSNGKAQSNNVISDKIPTAYTTTSTLKPAMLYITTTGKIQLISNFSTSSELKEWLASNPMTVQYELATESVKTVDLNVIDQNGNKLNALRPIEGTMNIRTDGTPIKPTFSGEIPVEAITQNISSFIE